MYGFWRCFATIVNIVNSNCCIFAVLAYYISVLLGGAGYDLNAYSMAFPLVTTIRQFILHSTVFTFKDFRCDFSRRGQNFYENHRGYVGEMSLSGIVHQQISSQLACDAHRIHIAFKHKPNLSFLNQNHAPVNDEIALQGLS